MKIRELYLKNFGKFSDKRIVLEDGINLFYGENEFGKTTIHTFIKSMLFGMERGRGRASANDTFSIYEPWENPNYYSGVLKFESGGKNFTLRRNFDKYGKSASLICEDDGEEFSIEHGDLEHILNGLGASNYENTVAVGQMKVETNQNLAAELQNYATNYYATGNSEIDLDGALNRLRNQKKDVEKEIRELRQKREEQIQHIEQERSYILRDVQKLEQEIEELDEKLAATQETVKDNAGWGKKFVLLLGIFLGSVVGMALFDISPIIVAAVVAISAIIILISGLNRNGKKEEDSENSRFLWQREHLQQELQEKQTLRDNLQEQIEELSETDDVYQRQLKKSMALTLAMERMTELSKDVHEELSIRLNEKASEVLSKITGGKYEMLFVDEKLRMSLYTQGRRISIDQVSRGTIEQIYFALRMAASEILHEEEYPVILDDTFVYYDDKRLENTLRWLKENKKQVLLFTCQKREGEILKRL